MAVSVCRVIEHVNDQFLTQPADNTRPIVVLHTDCPRAGHESAVPQDAPDRLPGQPAGHAARLGGTLDSRLRRMGWTGSSWPPQHYLVTGDGGLPGMKS